LMKLRRVILISSMCSSFIGPGLSRIPIRRRNARHPDERVERKGPQLRIPIPDDAVVRAGDSQSSLPRMGRLSFSTDPAEV
jgi:hypothetical protein